MHYFDDDDGYLDTAEINSESSGDPDTATGGFEAIGTDGKAVLEEMQPLHFKYKHGEISGEEYERLLCEAYRRHGFPKPDKPAYRYY